jgi:hypothetical protein
MFVDGSLFDETHETTLGSIGVLAEVEIRGDRLTLNALSIYPLETESLPIGVRQMIEILRSIQRDASEQGFRECIVNAKKLSGASPGRIVRFERRFE